MKTDKSSFTGTTQKWLDLLAIVQQSPTFTAVTSSKKNKSLQISRWLTENLFVFLLQYTGLMFSTVTPGLHPIWIASGTACAFIFMRGRTIIPGIWLGSFFALCSVQSVPTAIAIASIFALQPVCILFITYRYLNAPMPDFESSHSLIQFITLCILISMIASFSILAIFPNQPDLLVPRFLHWSLANLNGLIIFTCAIITWDIYFSKQTNTIEHKQFVIIALLALSILTIALCLSNQTSIIAIFTAAIFILMIVCSYYLDWCDVNLAIITLSIILSVGSYTNSPLFRHNLATHLLIYLEGFITITAITSLLIASRKRQVIHN